MKKTKIIIPALGLLLLSTAASVTGTVAWFASNSSVKATGIQITANSDSSFLIIGTSDDLDTVQGDNAISASLSAASARVLPVAHDAIANTTAATATDVSNNHHYAKAESPDLTIDEYNALPAAQKEGYAVVKQNGTNWYYQVADAVTASGSTKQKNYLTTLDTDYIIHQTVYVTMSVGSSNASNLKVKDVNFTITTDRTGDHETNNPVRVLVTSSTASVEFAVRSGSGAALPNGTALAASVTPDALIPIDIFVYYDGNDADVFTNNVANLEGATVDITFDVNRA